MGKRGSLLMGYRPTEERIKQEIKRLIERGKIKSISLNVARDTIDYEYLEER